MLDVEQMAKLRSELDIVQQNCHVFGEMLTEQIPGQEQPDDWALLQVTYCSISIASSVSINYMSCFSVHLEINNKAVLLYMPALTLWQDC